MATSLSLSVNFLPNRVQAGHSRTGYISGSLVSTVSSVDFTSIVATVTSGDITVTPIFSTSTRTNVAGLCAYYGYALSLAGGILDPYDNVSRGSVTLYAENTEGIIYTTDTFSITSFGAELAYRGRLIDEGII